VSVVIRMKKMGRKHRQFFRICATDPRNPRDGRVIEEIGTYDPHIPETDARTTFNEERLQYWLGTGAKPSERVAVLIKKYGPGGTHTSEKNLAREKLTAPKTIPDPGAPKYVPTTKEQAAAAQTEGHPAAGAEETETTVPKSRPPEEERAEAAEESSARKAEKHEMEQPDISATETSPT
jgi:small subunit ribosomal protein S16